MGEHRDLLAYLVRRLLENGANSSFVHQLADDAVDVDELLASPLAPAAAARRCRCRPTLYGAGAPQLDAASTWPCLAAARAAADAAVAQRRRVEPVRRGQRRTQVDAAMAAPARRLRRAGTHTPLAERAAMLRRAADALERAPARVLRPAGQGGAQDLGDCVAEVREAVDFCRYYADQAERAWRRRRCPAPPARATSCACTAAASSSASARGTSRSRSSPARWSRRWSPATRGRQAGRADAGRRARIGRAAARGRRAGATRWRCCTARARPSARRWWRTRAPPACASPARPQVAKIIQRTLAAKDGPIVPLIAETGGLNAMLVDSTALPEQVVDAVVQSAFRSAGQRCSALRLLCVHEGIADGVIEMIARRAAGAERRRPGRLLATDVGPVIDAEAYAGISAPRRSGCSARRRLLGETPAQRDLPRALHRRRSPSSSQRDRRREAGDLRPGAARGALGAATLDATWSRRSTRSATASRSASRPASTAARSASPQAARVGNVYVNRNMIGAVVGVQPFGGEGLQRHRPQGRRPALPVPLLRRADGDDQHRRGRRQRGAAGRAGVECEGPSHVPAAGWPSHSPARIDWCHELAIRTFAPGRAPK